MTLQLHCFDNVTVYVIPKNRKSNKYCVDRGKSGAKAMNRKCTIATQKIIIIKRKRKTAGKFRLMPLCAGVKIQIEKKSVLACISQNTGRHFGPKSDF